MFRSRSIVAPLVLIVLGVLFLVSNFGWIPNLEVLFHRWWPVVLIAVGVAMLLRR